MNINMCSNNGSSSACGCGSGGGGNDHGVTMWSSGLKKQQQQQQKRPRIPKRGPGVAELEKILREQESTDITTKDRGNNEGFLVSSSCLMPHYSSSSSSSCLKSHPPPPPPRLNSNNFPSAPKFDHVVPPTIGSMFGNTSTHSLGRNGGARSGEQELFPVDLTSCKSKPNLNEVGEGSQSDSGNSPPRNLSSESNHGWSYPTTIQKRNNGYTPPMMNQFHGTGGNQASSGSLSIGSHNHLESPSIQNSFYNYSTRSHDEPKMAGLKRSHTSSLDNSLIPPSNFQVLPSFSRYNRPQQSSTNESHGLSSYNPTNECYRDSKWGSTLELSNKRFSSENAGSSHANFPPFVVPEVPPPPPPMHLFQNVLSKGNMFPRQVIEDKMENSYQRSESSGQDRKPFFNFLEVQGQGGETDATTSGSNLGGLEGGGRGGLDLSLKL